MNLSDLSRLFQDQTLSVAHRSLGLIWSPSVADVLGPTLLPQRVHLQEGICEPTLARIACFTTQSSLAVRSFVGVPFALSMTTDRGARRLFPLIVSEASAGNGDGGVMTVNLVARDPLWFMGQRRRLRTFRWRSVIEVVTAVLDDWIKTSPVGATFTYCWLGVLADRYPEREQYIQHPDESDAEFVERLMRASGIAWVWRPKAVDSASPMALPQLELVLFDDGWNLPPDPASPIRFHRRDGTERADTIDLLAPVTRWVPGVDTVVSWNYRTANADSADAFANIAQSDAAQAIARTSTSVRVASPHLGDSWDDLGRLARVQANHQAFRAQSLHGRGGVRTMAPGRYQSIDGHGVLDKLPAAERDFITWRVEHFAQNSLPAELNASAQALIGDHGVPEWARPEGDETAQSAQRYTNRFWCVPRTTPIQPTFVAEHDQPRRRGLTGIVIASGGEITTDGLARTRVQLIGGDAEADTNSDTTAWVRHPVPWGGKDHGYVTPLRAGTEVDLEPLGPDRYVIVGSHYNGQTPPPRFDHLGGLPENAALSGIITRELGGDRQQQLRFNDSPGHISVQLGTDDAATQLNLGALITPMNRGHAQGRGRGFELRTDAAGALRSGESLLISTWKRLQAMGQVLDADEHLALMTDFADLFKGLGDYAGQHNGTPADTQPTTHLAADIKKGIEPAISITAPAGIASTTPKTILNYAGTNIDSVSMQHYQVTAGGHYLMNAGKGATLFAHQGGIKTIAHHGVLSMQSQHDDTQIDSAKDIKLSALGKIAGIGQDEVTFMTSGGAYIKLSGGNVELGGPGVLRVRTASHHWDGAGSMSSDLPSFGDGDLGRTPRLLNPASGAPVPDMQVRIEHSEGDISGTTNPSGQGPKLLGNAMQRFKAVFFDTDS